MNTEELTLKLEGHRETRNSFIGVFAADQLPERKKKGLYIVNLDKIENDGSHWVAMNIGSGKKKSFYFDSYGMPPPFEHFRRFLRRGFRWNKKQLQHPLSTTCGQWCLYFCLRQSQGWKLKSTFGPFSNTQFLANDHVVNEIVRENFQTEEKVIDRRFMKKQISKLMEGNLLWKEFQNLMKVNKSKKKPKRTQKL